MKTFPAVSETFYSFWLTKFLFFINPGSNLKSQAAWASERFQIFLKLKLGNNQLHIYVTRIQSVPNVNESLFPPFLILTSAKHINLTYFKLPAKVLALYIPNI